MVLQLMRRDPGRFDYGVQLAGFVVGDAQPGDEVLARKRLPVFWDEGNMTGSSRGKRSLVPSPGWRRTHPWSRSCTAG